ncbi:MAG: hypothetical protein ACK413_02640, partial [Patescibacteria group bacterium]
MSSIETKEPYFKEDKKDLFPEAQEKYNQLYENKEMREKVILPFLKKSEQKRLGCWRRNWEKIIHQDIEERKPGKELENVLAEIFNQFLKEEFEIYLASNEDDKKGNDLIIYNKEKDLLFSIDLTMNKKSEILENKIAFFRYDNPTSLNFPPEKRKNNPRVLRFLFFFPTD